MQNKRIPEYIAFKSTAVESITGSDQPLTFEFDFDLNENATGVFGLLNGGLTTIQLQQSDGVTTKDIPGAVFEDFAGDGLISISVTPDSLDINNGFKTVTAIATVSVQTLIVSNLLCADFINEPIDQPQIELQINA